MKLGIIHFSSVTTSVSLLPHLYLSSSASLSSSSFFPPSVSQTATNDPVIWKACVVFYSGYWLSNLVRLLKATSICKILINNILFSHPSYTQHFAVLSKTMTGKSIHMRRPIHMLTHVCTSILVRTLTDIMQSFYPLAYAQQSKCLNVQPRPLS